MHRVAFLLALLLLLGGCGEAALNSAEEFQGEERAVAQVVEDLQEAGERGDAERICEEILEPDLVAELRQAGSTCVAEIERSIQDADDFELQVEDVTVTGNRARATIRRGPDQGDEQAVFEFVKVGGEWRAAALAAG